MAKARSNKSEIIFGVVRVPLDFTLIAAAFILSWAIRSHTDLIPGVQLPIGYIPPFNEYLPFVIGSSAFLVIVYALNSMYSLKTTHRIYNEVIRVCFLNTAWVMLLIAYFFLTHQTFFSRLVLIYTWIFGTILIIFGRLLIRLIQRLFLKFKIGIHNVLFVGNNEISQTLALTLKKTKFYKPIGIVESTRFSLKKGKLKIIGTIKDIPALIEKYNIDEIIQTKSKLAEADDEKILEFCRLNHIRYRFVPDLLELQRKNIEIASVKGIPLIELKPTPLDGWGKVTKRIVDLLGSTFGIIILSPILLITAIIIKLESHGPVFFTQMRLGRNGKLFKIYKFRSMVADAAKQHMKLMEKSERKGFLKIKHDPRITKFGRFIRKTSIDELPQLFNVFIGNMSLIGPRPHMKEEVGRFKIHNLAQSIKPGISGLAQVSGRSNLSFDDEVKLDISYIENWSLLLDLKILIKTFAVVLARKDAS